MSSRRIKARQNLPEIEGAFRGKTRPFRRMVEVHRMLQKMAGDSKRRRDAYIRAENAAIEEFGAENADRIMYHVKKTWKKTKGESPEKFEKYVDDLINGFSKTAHNKHERH